MTTAASGAGAASALLPCPFCGGMAALKAGEAGVDGMPKHHRNPGCTVCGADMGYGRPDVVIAAWNRRASGTAGQDDSAKGQHPPRDWPEDFAHENGNYSCRCSFCGHLFHGDKHRGCCKQCATDNERET